MIDVLNLLYTVARDIWSWLSLKSAPKVNMKYESSDGEELFLLVSNQTKKPLYNLRFKFVSSSESNRMILTNLGLSTSDLNLMPGDSFKKKVTSYHRAWPDKVWVTVSYRYSINAKDFQSDNTIELTSSHLRDYTKTDAQIRMLVALASDPRDRSLPYMQERLDQLDFENPHIPDDKRWWNVASTSRRYLVKSRHRAESE